MLLEFLAGLFFILATADAGHDWGYDGNIGPIHWHHLFPEKCDGKKQSPIDIITRKTEYNPRLSDFALWYDPPKPDSKFIVSNNGHTVTVKTVGEFYVANGGLPNVYSTAQLHFHWGHANHHGSEHLIDGKASPLELHIVNYDSDTYVDIVEAMVKPQGLAVLGVMFEMTEQDNPAFTPIIEALEKIKDPDLKSNVEIPPTRLRDFLPEDTTRYFRYNGSLTTPGCFESVIWTLFAEKQTISYNQLFKFRSVLQSKRRRNKKARLHHHTHDDGQEGGSKFRRSRRLRRNAAEKVLDEVGIKGDIAKEIELKLELEQMRKITHDVPDHEHHHQERKTEEGIIGEPDRFQLKAADNPDLDENNVATAEPTTEPTPEPEHHDHKEEKAEDHSHENHHSNKASGSDIDEYIIIQDILVNNFRPVQKLNGRTVYRSFDDVISNRRANVRHAPVSDKGDNSAATSLSSVVIIVTSVLATITYSQIL